MRVLLTLASASLTGPAERLLGDAEVLRQAGHAVLLGFDQRRPDSLLPIAEARGFEVARELVLSRKSGPFETLRDIGRLRQRLRAGIDLIHTHFSQDHHVALLARVGLQPAPLVVRSLERAEDGHGWALAATDGLEVPSEALLSAPRLAHHRAAGRLRALPSAVDPLRFSPGSGAALRAELGLPPEAILVGCVSRLKADRRLEELLRAFAALAPREPRAALVLIGRGEGRPALEAQAARLGLTAQVRFAGYWSGARLLDAYRGLDVVVWLVAGNDGGARGVLEAMAVGKPVVSYRLPPMAEQLAEGAGLLVAEGAITELSSALAALIGDPGQRSALGKLARARVCARYTWAQRGPALLDFYDRLRGA